MKKITIGLSGSTQIEHIAKVLEKDYNVIYIFDTPKGIHEKKSNLIIIKLLKWFRAIIKLNKVDILYNVYTIPQCKLFRLAKLCKTRIITEWIGTDVYNALLNPVDYNKGMEMIDIHLACSFDLKKELNSMGIESTVVPIIPFHNIRLDVAEMPAQHEVIIYMPTGKEDFYGFDILKNIFEHYPNTIFHIVANENKLLFSKYPNVILEGYLTHEDMEKLYDNISIVIRHTVHDGLSMSIIEGLSKGKIVFWNHNHPYTIKATKLEEYYLYLDQILENKPEANYEEVEFIKKNYNIENIRGIVKKEIEEI